MRRKPRPPRMARSAAPSATAVSISARLFTAPFWRGPLKVSTVPASVMRTRSAQPEARMVPWTSSKRTLSSKCRGRTARAPRPTTRARASAGPAMRSLTSVSTFSATGWRRPGLLDDFDRHLDAVLRVVLGVPRRADDLVRHIHAARHLPEGGVLAVEEVRVLHHDEELAARAVRAGGAGHGDDAAGVGRVVELGLDLVAGVPGAVHGAVLVVLGVRVAALDHETGDHAVEGGLVVEALLREVQEVLDVARSLVVQELDLHLAELRGDDGARRGCGHEHSS